MLNAVPAG